MFERTKAMQDNYPEGDIKTGKSTLEHINRIIKTLIEESEQAISAMKKPASKTQKVDVKRK